MLATETFDLILMDINLGKGKMNGVETMYKIKANPRTNSLNVVAVTSYALPEDKERFLREGFDGYIPKPVDRQILLKTIHQYLG